MSAQPAEAGQPARPEPTIRMVRAALPEAHRDAFQAEIERTPCTSSAGHSRPGTCAPVPSPTPP